MWALVSTDGKLTTLPVLLLSANVSSLGILIGSVDIEDNLRVSGKIPSELRALSSLQYLNIGELRLDHGQNQSCCHCAMVLHFT